MLSGIMESYRIAYHTHQLQSNNLIMFLSLLLVYEQKEK